MARTVIYPARASSDGRAASSVAAGGGSPPDKYAEKLAKFIPAETVAFFVPIASVAESRPGLLVTAGLIGLLATPAYLWTTARDLAPELRPRWHFYVLAMVAFAIWALGTSKLGALVGLDSIETAFMLGVGVFLVPLIDSLLTRK